MVDLERAKIHLKAWLDAEIAVSTGQSYTVGDKSLTRANLSEIRQSIQFWRKEVNKLSGSGRRSRRFIPRDL